MKFRIQIAGIDNASEAKMLVDEGVDDLAFPLGPGVKIKDLSEESAAAITRTLPDSIGAVLITYLKRADEVAELADKVRATKVQLHGECPVLEIAQLKKLRPELYLIKSLVIGSRPQQNLIQYMNECMPWVDAFLTDSFDPVNQLSGVTGKTHDWSISQRIVQASARPVLLAGGLNAENVTDAVSTVRPYGVDSHTGVEDESGRKDPAKVRAFVAKARQAASLYSV